MLALHCHQLQQCQQPYGRLGVQRRVRVWGPEVVRTGPTWCGVGCCPLVTGVRSVLVAPIGFTLGQGILDPRFCSRGLYLSVSGCRFQCPPAGWAAGTVAWPVYPAVTLGCVARRCAQEPPPSSALFARLPKPHHLVWLKSGLGPITTCLRPFGWLIFTFVQNGPFSRIFYTPPLAGKGVLAPFPHPFCTLFAPFVHPPFLR